MTFAEHLQFLDENKNFQLWKAVIAASVSNHMGRSNSNFERVCNIVYDYTFCNEVSDTNSVAYIIVDGFYEHEITLDDPKLSYYIKRRLDDMGGD